MESRIAKSKFKPRALQYFREIEQTGRSLIITDRGRAVLKIVPFAEDPLESLVQLRNSVIKYDDPLAPVGVDDWEALK